RGAPVPKPAISSAHPGLQTSAPNSSVSPLPGTSPLTAQGDLAMQMVDGIHRHLLAQTAQQATERPRLWNRDFSSAANYEQSVAANRERFRRIIGTIDERAAARAPEIEVAFASQTEIAQSARYTIYAIQWRVFGPVTSDSGGMTAMGLLLQPKDPPLARVVAIPDADCTPEMLAGIEPGIPAQAQFARILAECGIQVIVPLIINRDDSFSGILGIGMTNMPHREWIYRMAFEAGRHIIGLEVQSILAAVDWFEHENRARKLAIGVMGYGEGGLLALYSAAIDTRIKAAVVSGYFQARENVWQEPIYRDVWGLVKEFGDSELAGLIAPRTLIVEASQGPQVTGPPPATDGHQAFACPNGTLKTPSLEDVKIEVERARPIFRGLRAEEAFELVISADGFGLPGSESTLRAFLQALNARDFHRSREEAPAHAAPGYDASSNMQAQFNELVDFTQALIRKSPDVRREFWSRADASSIENWKDSTKHYRDFIWTELIGRLPSPSAPPNPRTRMTIDAPGFRGYEVMLDVWHDAFAYGILLLPKDLKPGERRPVVVCQHGLEGRPTDVTDPKVDSHFYHHFGASLADDGFIVYAPQNPYIGEDKFRIIQRMGHPLKLSLFSYILGQHEQTLKWLSAQPFVNPERIGFYGLSYGGKTAVRVPPLLDGYALSICSGDFNEWVWKTTTVLAPQSYLLTKEYDMYEFDLANIVNYSDLANLMAPRPFMVERGHDDPVSVDSEVAFEYAKVREFYDEMNIGDRTEIEFFNGPHEIHGKGTFEFLKKHLRWPG
ncbi:MAG: dienelactone hydrolase family protein, partial [Terracidiphilus sp.]